MKMTVKNLQFNLSPIALTASDSDANRPEDMNVNLSSEGGSFGIEEISMEISIAELSSFCGKATTAAPTEADKAKADEARAKANEALGRASEITDMCRAILNKVNDLKASSKAPASPKAPKKPKTPEVGKIEVNDEF